jgi:tripartite-type tricarboxylate transporter receptor subunit TctC
MTPAEFTKHVRAEVAKMGKIIKASGAKAEQ